jgi:hypothetical protein
MMRPYPSYPPSPPFPSFEQGGIAGGGASRFLKEVQAVCSGSGSSSALSQLQQLVEFLVSDEDPANPSLLC